MIVCFVWFVHWLEETELNEAPESSEKFRSSGYNFDEHAQSRNVNIIPSGNVASDTGVSWLMNSCYRLCVLKKLLMVLVTCFFAIKQNSNMVSSGEVARHLDWKDASFVDSVG